MMRKIFRIARYRHLRLDSRLQFATFVLLYIFTIMLSLLVHLWALQASVEQAIVNTFIMTAILFVIRKILVIEQHVIPTICEEMAGMLKSHHDENLAQIETLYERIRSAIPLGNVEYIPNSDSWHHKAISIVHSLQSEHDHDRRS
jgi:hypothetical protein